MISKKMFDFIKYDKFEVKDIPLMKFGRHLRLEDKAKLVVGRNEEENKHLENIDNEKYYHMATVGIPGPHAMLSKSATAEDKELAAKVILTYCKTDPQNNYTVSFDGEEVTLAPLESRDAIKPFSIL